MMAGHVMYLYPILEGVVCDAYLRCLR